MVTGGASGIGKGVAEALLAEGAHVLICDVQDKLGEALAATSPNLHYMHCDVTADMGSVGDVAAAKLPNGASIWLLNAGVNTEVQEDILSTTDGKLWRKMVDINLSAVIDGTQAAYAHFERFPDGNKFIIGTASMAGLLPQAQVVYSATKAAVVQFMRSIALRVHQDGHRNIWCYALCPSFTDTPLARGDMTVDEHGAIQRGGGAWDEATRAHMARAIGGILTVEDQVKGVMGLLAQRPASGSVLRVTLRKGGAVVAHDLVSYTRDLGGPGPPRPGIPLFPAAAKL